MSSNVRLKSYFRNVSRAINLNSTFLFLSLVNTIAGRLLVKRVTFVHLNIQFLNYVLIIKTKILLHQGCFFLLRRGFLSFITDETFTGYHRIRNKAIALEKRHCLHFTSTHPGLSLHCCGVRVVHRFS